MKSDFILLVAIAFFVSSIYLFGYMNQCFTMLDIVIYFGGYFMLVSSPIVIGLFMDKKQKKKEVEDGSVV